MSGEGVWEKFLHKKSLYLISSLFLSFILHKKNIKKTYSFFPLYRVDDNTEIRMLSIGYSGLQFAIKLVLVSFTFNRICV